MALVPVVWLGATVAESEYAECNKFIASAFGLQSGDVSTIGIIYTNPDNVGPGGRSDYLFWIRPSAVPLFAAKRLHPRFGGEFRWFEDVIGNDDKDKVYDSDDILNLDPELKRWM